MFHKRRDWIAGAVLFGLTFAVFSRVLNAEFVQWDDDISVAGNVQVQGLDWSRLKWMFTDSSYAMRYKPLTWLSYAVVYQIGGLKPFNYHLVNLLLHSLNAVLAFVLIRRLLALSNTEGTLLERLERGRVPAALGALLWAVHPLRVEPVARVTDLTYLLVFFCVMLSLWCYLKAHELREQPRERRLWYGGSVAAYAVAMLCYPFALGWAFVLLAIDWYPLRRFAGGVAWWRDTGARALLREKIPFLLWGALVLTTLLARRDPSVAWAESAAGPGLNGFERVMQALYVWGYYVWKPWAPFHLSPVYTALVRFDANGWRFLLSAVLVLGITAVLVWRQRIRAGTPDRESGAPTRAPGLALWAAYLILLLPALGLTEHPHYTSDRYDYIPGLAWALILAGILWKLSARPKLRAGGIACALALAALWAGLSFQQARIWRNSLGLFEYMVGELGDDPRRADLRRRLGGMYASLGRFEDAARQYETSLRLAPAAKTYQAAAEFFERHGDAQAALTNYVAWLQLEPDPLIHLRAAAQLSRLGRSREAIVHYRQALSLRPDFAPALEKLAWLLATDPDAADRSGAEAVQMAERGCGLTGYQAPGMLASLAAAYAEAGRFPEAITTAQKAYDRAQATGDAKLADKCRKLQGQFEARKPWRE
jgi:tetratricopeptide (TPR) repeat protein